MLSKTFEFSAGEAESFAREVTERSGQPLNACYQCRRCASGCPVCEEGSQVTPDRLIRMVLLGDREAALSNDLIWKCVSCFTCGTRCPNNIRTGKISETLRKMAVECGIEPLMPEVHHFHTSFLNDSLRWGRINEIGFMGEYELRNIMTHLKHHDPKAILKEIKERYKFLREMIRLGRFHFKLQTSDGRREIDHLLVKSREYKWK